MKETEIEHNKVDNSKGRRTAEFPLRAFFGHHKCATGWIDGILMEICFHMGIHFKMAHLPHHFEPHGSLGAFVRDLEVDFLAYTNADRKYLSDLEFHRGFHVVRDPRDVLVSAYFSHRNSHSTKNWNALESHKEELKQLSKEEGLFREMDFSQKEFEEMYTWDYDQVNVLELKMERLTAEPIEGFVRIAAFLEILDSEAEQGGASILQRANLRMNRLNHKGRRFMPGNIPMFPVPRRRQYMIPSELIEEIIRKKSFERLSGGRKKGQENVNSHYRKGTPGDWRNHFSEGHKTAFKDKYNHVLVKLGYEKDDNW